jgi:hypothetical protein
LPDGLLFVGRREVRPPSLLGGTFEDLAQDERGQRVEIGELPLVDATAGVSSMTEWRAPSV